MERRRAKPHRKSEAREPASGSPRCASSSNASSSHSSSASCCRPAAIGGAYWFANDKWDAVPNAQHRRRRVRRPRKGKPANFLIIGSDTRSFVKNAKEAEAFGDPNVETGQRSDTMMVAHIDPKTDTGMLVSFPRDLWVNVPGRGQSKLNAAFNDGPQRVIETLKQNFDIPIHHYLEVDFAGFQNLVDAVGGRPDPVPDPGARRVHGPADPPARLQAHERQGRARVRAVARTTSTRTTSGERGSATATSDLGRIARQQYFIRSLAEVAINTAGEAPVQGEQHPEPGVREPHQGPSPRALRPARLAATLREADPDGRRDAHRADDARQDRRPETCSCSTRRRPHPIFERLRSFGPKPKPLPVPTDVVPAQVKVKVSERFRRQRPGEAHASTRSPRPGSGGSTRRPTPTTPTTATTEVRYARGGGTRRNSSPRTSGSASCSGARTRAGADVTVVLGDDFDKVTTPTTATADDHDRDSRRVTSGPRCQPRPDARRRAPTGLSEGC